MLPQQAQPDADGFVTVDGRGHKGKPWTSPQAKLPLDSHPTIATLSSLAKEVQSNVGDVNIRTPPTAPEGLATTHCRLTTRG